MHGRLASDLGANLAATRSGVLTAVVARRKMPLIDEKPDSKYIMGDGSFTKAACPTWLEEAGQIQDLQRVCSSVPQQRTCSFH